MIFLTIVGFSLVIIGLAILSLKAGDYVELKTNSCMLGTMTEVMLAFILPIAIVAQIVFSYAS